MTENGRAAGSARHRVASTAAAALMLMPLMLLGTRPAVGLTVVLCFAIGGGLMALIFISSRRGYDEAAHSASLDLEDEGDPRAARSEPPPGATPPLRKS